MLSRLLYAGQVSLTVGLVAALMSTTIGLVLGSLAGTYGGWVDTLIMRATDVVLSFPVLVVIMTVVALVGPSVQTIILGIGLFYWPTVVPHRARPGAVAARAGLLPGRARARRNPTTGHRCAT